MKKLLLLFFCCSLYSSEIVKRTLPALKIDGEPSAPQIWPAVPDKNEKIEIDLREKETHIKFSLADKTKFFVQNNENPTVEEVIFVSTGSDRTQSISALVNLGIFNRFWELKTEAEKFAREKGKKSWSCFSCCRAPKEWRTFVIKNGIMKEK